MDINISSSHGDLHEEVLMKPLAGFESEVCPDYVYHLQKVVYGLKQTSRALAWEFAKVIAKNFEMSILGEINFFS